MSRGIQVVGEIGKLTESFLQDHEEIRVNLLLLLP